MAISRRSFIGLMGTGMASVLAGGALAGCGGSSSQGVSSAESAGSAGSAASSSTAQSQVVVTMTPSSEPAAGFDPLVSWGCGEHVHEPLIQSTLITTDTDLNFVNDLATGYECADDGMSWTFKIRDDVKFSDGTPLTASDVAFTFNGIIASEASEADLTSVREVTAPDDTTAVFAMNKPNNALLYTIAVVGIVPEASYGEGYGSKPIGSGRYMLEQWDRGQQAILVPNPLYYGPKPNIDRLVVLFMEEDASLAAAQAGQVDVAYTSAALAANTPKGFELLVCDTVDSRGISLPTVPAGGEPKVEEGVEYPVGNDVTCDLAIRRALNCGIDRTRMIQNVLNGYGAVAYSVSDGMPWASPDMRVETDVQKAKDLLADAGWTAGNDGILQKDGQRAAFDLYYSASDSTRQALAADFAAQASELGMEVNIKGASWDDIYQREYADPVVWGWGSNAPIELYELTYSKGWGNFADYENEQVDTFLDAALATKTVAESYPLYQKAQWDPDTQTGVAPQGAATWVWLANVDHLYFVRDGLNVAEQKLHPHGHGWSLVNNIDQWSWE